MTPLCRLGFLENCPERLVEVVGLSRHLFSLAIAAQPRPYQGRPLTGRQRGSGVACFWATSLEKIIGTRSAQEDGCSSLPCRGVLSFLSEAREASGSEAPRVHHAARRRGGMAARGAPAMPGA